MNPMDADKAWSRLVSAARSTPKAGDMQAPLGFTTRVVARAFARPPVSPARILIEQMSWKVLFVSALLMLVCLAGLLPKLTSTQDDEATPLDPVSELVEIGG